MGHQCPDERKYEARTKEQGVFDTRPVRDEQKKARTSEFIGENTRLVREGVERVMREGE
jgi:hypothetical protein